jgi:hypothetical protein
MSSQSKVEQKLEGTRGLIERARNSQDLPADMICWLLFGIE